MIIDAHVHHMPLEVYRKFADPTIPFIKVPVNGHELILNARLHKLDDQLRALDEGGVDMAVLTFSQWNPAGAAVCRQINEGMANLVAKYPDRLRATACVPVGDPETAAAEIDYAIWQLKLSGLALLTSHSQELTPSNKDQMWPIYSKAVEHDVPIFWHPNLLPDNTLTACTIDRTLGRGYDVSQLVLRAIYDILPEFPSIKMVIPHLGGGFLAHKQRAIAFFEPPPALAAGIPPALKHVPKTPIETEELGLKAAFDNRFDRLYIDGAGTAGWAPMVKMGFMAVRHDHLVFGSDYPFEVHAGRDYKYYLDNVRAMDISEESRQAFLGQNLARLLKLRTNS